MGLALSRLANMITEKYLQAVQALNRAKTLDAEHPQLHVRLVHLRTTGMPLFGTDRYLTYDIV